MISLAELQRIMPKAGDKALIFLSPLNLAMKEFDIDNPARQAAFLAQIAHESGQLRWTREIWGPTEQQKKYEPPGRLAADLGNCEEGDGFKFRGRGLIQITGRANYRACGGALGMDLITLPWLLEQPVPASRSAGWFWKTHGLNELADKGDFKLLTKRINGGFNGYADRLALFNRAQQVLA